MSRAVSRRELLAMLAAGRLPGGEAPVFRDVAAETGLNFRHVSGATGRHYMPEIMGAGAALFDYDNDGDLDVYLVQGNAGPNRLFRNLLSETGKLRFADVTEKAGVGHAGEGMGVAVGDYDNDGYLDLYVTNFGPNVLYHNNGDGTFTDVTAGAGVDDPRWSTSAAWLDFDGDGYLDLFVCNYVDFTVAGNRACFTASGEPDYCTPKMYRPVPSRLFRNLRNGRFEDVTEASRINTFYGPALGVVCADFDGDGRTDIYIANDTAANLLWLNRGGGTFRESALEAGVAYSMDGLAKAGMGVALADDRDDGSRMLLVTNLTGEGVTLFHGNARGQFDDVTAESGLLQPTFGFTGFGTQWIDYDNDGRLDLFIANGAVTRPGRAQGYAQRNQLFHNEGRGKRFREIPAFQLREIGRGVAAGDIDNDGALDLLVTNNNGPARLLRNQAGLRGHWLIVKLESPGTNRFAIGARAGVVRRGAETIWRRVHADSSYLSASDIRLHFGLGDQPDVEAVLVHWPDGGKEKFGHIRSDRIATLRQGSGERIGR